MRLFTITMLLLTTAIAKCFSEDGGGGVEHGQQCYACGGGSPCGEPERRLCRADRPLCATSIVIGALAASQDDTHTSLLTCSGEHVSRPCSLARSNGLYELYCACAGRLCNAPFTKHLLDQLQRFVDANVLNGTNLIEQFVNSSSYSGTLRHQIYEAFTDVVGNDIMELDEGDARMPAAEALIDAAVAPSDDEEDEGEGSGLEGDSPGHGTGLASYVSPRTTAKPAPNRAALPLSPILVTQSLLLINIYLVAYG